MINCSSEPFENPDTSEDDAVQFKVAFTSEATSVIEVLVLVHKVVGPEEVIEIAGNNVTAVLVLLLHPLEIVMVSA